MRCMGEVVNVVADGRGLLVEVKNGIKSALIGFELEFIIFSLKQFNIYVFY